MKKKSFRKRKTTLFNKINFLNQQNADVYVVLRRYNRFYTYISFSSRWPPSLKKIVGFFFQISSTEENLIEKQKQNRDFHIESAYFDKFINIDKNTRIVFTSVNLNHTSINEANHTSTETEPKPFVDVNFAADYSAETIETKEKSEEQTSFHVFNFLFHQDRYHSFKSVRSFRKFWISMPSLLSTSPFSASDDISIKMIGWLTNIYKRINGDQNIYLIIVIFDFTKSLSKIKLIVKRRCSIVKAVFFWRVVFLLCMKSSQPQFVRMWTIMNCHQWCMWTTLKFFENLDLKNSVIFNIKLTNKTNNKKKKSLLIKSRMQIFFVETLQNQPVI